MPPRRLGRGCGRDRPCRSLVRVGPPIPAGPAPNYAAVADLNGDGRLDLAVADSGYWNDVRILLGNGSGAFRPAGPPLAIGGNPGGMTAADFNGDQKPDLAVASDNPDVVKILLGDGSGGMTAAAGAPVALGGATTGTIMAADLNRDGKVGLVVPFLSQGAYRAASLLGDGMGGFTRPAAPPARLGGRGRRHLRGRRRLHRRRETGSRRREPRPE